MPALIEMTKRDDDDHWLRERAIFWLGNAGDDRGRATLRTLAASDTLTAIFAVRPSSRLASSTTMATMARSSVSCTTPRRRGVKDKVIQAVAQLDETDDQRWLVQRVLDTKERVDLRKQALFWRGQKQRRR